MARIYWQNDFLKSVSTSSEVLSPAARRSGNGSGLPSFLLDGNLEIETREDLEVKPGVRRGEIPNVVDFSIEGDEADSYVAVIRHASGALTFHPPERMESRRTSARAKPKVTYHFRCPIHFESEVPGRRGLISRVIKVFVLKVLAKAAEKITERAIPKLAQLCESRIWKSRELTEGWHRVSGDTLRSGRLEPVDLKRNRPTGRALLFLHGTFSHAVGAFGRMDSRFFEQIGARYGKNVYAFNHFTISKTPGQNARDLLNALPSGGIECDVITHSRGGLVLRTLVERKALVGAAANRLKVGRAILVAAPNEGTPLATSAHWERTIGFFANFLEMFPDNPFTTAAEFISDALVWMAKRATGELPGVASMDRNGAAIRELQAPPAPDHERYSALVANYHPEETIWARLADVGVDGFFGMANDLVVPSEGGWRIDDGTHVRGDRIGCFGRGGNIQAPGNVHHGNFFDQPETIEFLVRVSVDGTPGLLEIDPDQPLPDRRFRRGLAGISETTNEEPVLEPETPADVVKPRTSLEQPDLRPFLTNLPENAFSALNLVILPPPNDDAAASILATYANARVLEPFPTRGDEAGRRWQSIISFNEGIENYINGKPRSSLPTESQVLDIGAKLFKTLFPGDVQRIYDVARSSYKGDRLPVILTSMIPWVAEKPWEFAYDAARNTFLATEEIHFIRNVLTAIPAEEVTPSKGPLRILVVVAQPVGTGQLSSDQEISVIRRGFAPLIESGLVEVAVLPKATPRKLHSRIANEAFDVVHCICHGEFDAKENRGYLLFETGDGLRPHRIDERMAREILCQRGVRLVFLNACETGRGGNANFSSGVAQALVAGGMPAVIANQYKVLDYSATAFSQHFYWCIAQGMSIGEAAREARISVRYASSSEPIDWAVPVVYSRNSETRFCERRRTGQIDIREAISGAIPTAQIKVPRKRDQTYRVGVWDISYAFPELETTLEKFNTVQNRYEFRTVSLSLPLSARISLEGEDYPFLDADAIAERMALKPKELGMDFLAFITNEPLACRNEFEVEEDEVEYTANIYGWADETGQSPIGIFSTAGLAIPPAGIKAERAIANAMVFSLTVRLAGVKSHERGPSTCPLYYNAERDSKQITGIHRFDATCKRLLRKRIPDDLPALEAILDAVND